MIVSLFDENDKLIKVDYKSLPIDKQTKEEFLIDFELPADVENNYIKAFIWNSLDGIKPLSKATVFSQEN